jgi:hypothetical protein
MRTIAALFDQMDHAHAAVRDLRDLGLSNKDISLVAHDVAGEFGQSLNRGDWGKAPAKGDGAAAGAGIGAVLGGLTGLLVGLGALVIPGIGPVLAAGPLGSALAGLVGAGVGAVGGGLAGGLLGALVDMGIPEEEAQYYAEGVRRGGALVTARVDDMLESQVRDVMRRHHAVDVERRAEDWRQRGWTGYNPRSEPYTAQQVADERKAYTMAAGASTLSNMATPPPNAVNMSDALYRDHYQTNYSSTGRSYDLYRPAYDYGRTLRDDTRYRGWTWDRVEPEARRDWERRYPNNAWEDFKAAVRHAWENVKDAVGDREEKRRY